MAAETGKDERPGATAVADAHAAATSPFDLGVKLAQRRDEHAADREVARRRVEQEASALRDLQRRAPRRPRDGKAALRSQAARLERERTRTSLPLAREKALVRQIAAAEREVRQHGEAEKHQALVRRKKAEAEAARERLRQIDLLMAEIEVALSKADLGKRLGCLPSEVVSREHGFPMDKLRWVLGPDGARVRAIAAAAGVQIECDKLRGKFVVSGATAGVEDAVARLEIYTGAVDAAAEVSADVVAYLLAPQSGTALARIRDDHPDVRIDLPPRGGTTITLCGHPRRVEKAREDLGRVRVVSQPRSLVGKEVSLVVGALHATGEKHGVVLDLSKGGDKETTTLRITGPGDGVAAAAAELDRLLFDREEVEEVLRVDSLLRGELLHNNAANLKEFQRSLSQAVAGDRPDAGGVLLSLDRPGSSKREESKLLLRCRRCVMGRAKALATKKVEEFRANVTSFDVPTDMVHVVIGRGGATISELRKEGNKGTTLVEAHETGTIQVYSPEAATRDAVRRRVERLVAENQTGSVPIEKHAIGLVLGEHGKEVRQACAALGCPFHVSDDDARLVFKGTNEQIAEASALATAFLARNRIAELEVSAEDEPLLFKGGAASVMLRAEADHDVKVSFRKGKHALQVRGEAEQVRAARDDLERFLHGGEGVAVCKFAVNEHAIGSVIGKGGSNIAKLEQEFPGVLVHVPKEGNRISLRGPEDLVRQCRSRLVTTIATTRVNETVDVDEAQRDRLANSDALKHISRLTNTQITLNETSVKVRGVSDDVRDARFNLTEHLTRVYQGIIELETSQFGKVKKDLSHLQRINASTGAEVKLDNEAIVISGKRAQVKKAKASVLDFLDFMLPRQLQTVKIHRSLFKSMGDPGRLAQFSSETRASLSLDRDLSSILIRSEHPEDCDSAVELVNGLMVECEKLVHVLRFDSSDAWVLPKIVGKGGVNIKRIEKDTDCSIDIFKDEVTLVVSADKEETARAGKIAVEQIVEQVRKECVFLDLPESSLSSFIGKSGAGIKGLETEHGVQIERLKKSPHTIKITGKENCVTSARAAVLSWVQEWEASHAGVAMEVEEQLIRAIIGKGGETIRTIEKDTGCKVDINRQNLTLTVREGSAAAREDAIGKIQAIIEEETTKSAARAAAKTRSKQEPAPTKKEREFNPAIDGTEEGRQLYHWILTGRVGDAIADVVYSDGDAGDASYKSRRHGSTITVRQDSVGNEVTYYQSESGAAVRLPLLMTND